MMESTTVREGVVDRWLGRTVAINWEMVAWIAIFVLALVTRLYDLGGRAMSHDESLHTYYSWKLFDGQGYQHDPMMHGPVLYHATALSYWLFGVSDFTARLLPVLAGVLLVLSPLLLRKWLGAAGALATGAMLLVSPTVMYYSRYIRHDIPVELFTVLMAVGFIRFLDDRRGRWIVLALGAGAGAMTSAEMAYINAFVLVTFVGIALLVERLGPRAAYWLEFAFLVVGLGLLLFASVATMGRLGDVTTEGSPRRVLMQMGFLLSGILLVYGLVSPLLSRVRSVPRLARTDSAWHLGDVLPDRARDGADAGRGDLRLAIIGTVVIVLGVLFWRLPSMVPALALGPAGLLGIGLGWFLLLFGIAGRVARAAGRAAWLALVTLGVVGGGVWVAVWSVVEAGGVESTGRLTALAAGPRGPVVALVLASLAIAAVGVLAWLLEARTTRGLPAALADAPVDAIAAGVVVFAVIYLLLFTTFFTNPAGVNGFVRSVEYWLDQHDVVRGGQPWYYYGLFTPMYEFLPFLLCVIGVVWYALRRDWRVGRGNDGPDDTAPSPAAWAFVPMLIAWALGNFWIYSWAGEKMPWLIVHLVVPMTFLGGRVIGDWVDALTRLEVPRRAWQVAGLTVLLVGALGALAIQAPFQGQTQAALTQTSSWLVGLVIAGLVVAALWHVTRGLRRVQGVLVAALTLAGLLFVVNIRYSILANFVNDELATEYIVYAHGTPDDKEVYNLLVEMQARLGVGDPLSLGYDNEVSWPFTWYFRDSDWSAAQYLGEKPSGALQNDVVLVGSPNYGSFEPYLRDRYVSAEFRRMWWPNEGYKGLTPAKVWENLVDPKLRRNWLNILVFRQYTVDPLADDPQPKPLNDWYHHANMKLYVRKDLINKVWPLVEARPDWLQEVELETPPSRSVKMTVEQTYEQGADGQPIVTPKDIALGPDGRLYVVDQGQYRIVVFGADGKAQAAIASGDLKELENDPAGASAWGVGVGPDGAVYIADTWNHRLLKYVDGRKVGQFGQYGNPTTADVQPELLFGPRDVAIGPDGNLYVTDTGNDRIVILDPSLKPIRTMGGSGIETGRFDEPTSLAFDPATGELVVADLWNLRVQRFDRNLMPVSEFVVDGWASQEAAHKAYIAVGPGSTVIASDPIGQRVWVWDRDGALLATLDLPDDSRGLDQPIGVVVDETGRIYVASSNSGIVTRYAPLEALVKAGGGAGEAEGDGEEGAEVGGEAAAGESGEGEGEPAAGASPTASAVEGVSGSPTTAAGDDGEGASPTVAEGESSVRVSPTGAAGEGAEPTPTAR